jgi:hypothetical protein
MKEKKMGGMPSYVKSTKDNKKLPAKPPKKVKY